MQHHFRINSSANRVTGSIKFTVRDNWLDDSAPMFEIEARSKACCRDDSESGKIFAERAVIDVNKSSVMVEQGHGGASSHMVSHHRIDRELQAELVSHVTDWVREVADRLEMALEGRTEFFEQDMSARIVGLEGYLDDISSKEKGRRWMSDVNVKRSSILLRMNCSSMLFLVRQNHISEDAGMQLLAGARDVFVRLHDASEDGEVQSLSSQAVSILSTYLAKEPSLVS